MKHACETKKNNNRNQSKNDLIHIQIKTTFRIQYEMKNNEIKMYSYKNYFIYA